MKKIAVMIATMLAIASLAYAAPASLGNNKASNAGVKLYGTPNTTSATPILLGALSKSVIGTLNVSADNNGANAGKEAGSYALFTYHLNGTKAYGSASQDTKMYNTDKQGDTWNIAITKTDSSAFTAWTSM